MIIGRKVRLEVGKFIGEFYYVCKEENVVILYKYRKEIRKYFIFCL